MGGREGGSAKAEGATCTSWSTRWAQRETGVVLLVRQLTAASRSVLIRVFVHAGSLAAHGGQP